MLKKLVMPILFLLLALTLVIVPWHSGYIYSGSDLRFHVNRIMEFVRSGYYRFPLVNFATFNNIGYDVNSFYPSLTLYLSSPIFLLKNSVNAYYILLLCLLFLTQMCAYLAARTLKMARTNAALFAMLYTFSEYVLFVYFYAFEVGEALAFIALPFLMTSLISYTMPEYTNPKMNCYRDEALILSLSWITYSHILSTLLCGLMVAVILIFHLFKSKDWRLLGKYVFLGSVYLLTTSFFWINFLRAYWRQGIVGPPKYLSILNVQQLLNNSLDNKLMTGNFDPLQSVGIGLVLLVSALILITNWRGLTQLQKLLLLFAGLFLMLSTDLFCWSFLDSHFKAIETIQYPFRFLIIVILLLAVAICLGRKANWSIVCLMAICISIFNINSGSHFVETGQAQESFISKPKLGHEPKYADFKVDKGHFKYLYQGFYGEAGGPGDYLTQKQKSHFNSIAKHEVLVNGVKHQGSFTSTTNVINYDLYLSRTGTVDLPVLKTNHTYQVSDNNHVIKHEESRRGTIAIQQLSAGRHSVRVRVMPSITFRISQLLTVLGLLALLTKYLKDRQHPVTDVEYTQV